jgi:uncharacterized protein (DUF58 family)
MQTTTEIIKQVKKIEITTKKLVDGIIAGNYHSIFKGQGIEFSEIREYFPGDDVRSIDWNVTARMNHPYIKEFIEERDLRIYFVFDVSSSGEFGSNISKNNKALLLISSLMFSGLRNNDNIGMILFTNNVEKYIPARKGKKHALKMISTLLSFKPNQKTTDIEQSLMQVSKIIKKKSVVFIISDFYSKDFTRSLNILKNKHDVIAVNISDNREKEMPNVGLIQLEDEETEEQLLIDTSDELFRNRYHELMLAKDRELNKQLKKMKIDSLQITTSEQYETPLKRFFSIRKRRMHR